MKIKSLFLAVTAAALLPATQSFADTEGLLPSLGGLRAKELHVGKDGLLMFKWGKVVTLSQVDAIKACAALGMHLPTIRELVTKGPAAGLQILELTAAEKEDQKVTGYYPLPKDSFDFVSARNPDGKKDQFFVNNEKFKSPSALLASHPDWSSRAAWSSSTMSDGAFSDTAYEFSFDDGAVSWAIRKPIRNDDGSLVEANDGAARCYPGKMSPAVNRQ